MARWRPRLQTAMLWAAAIAVIWVSVVRGRALQRVAPEVFLGAAPLVGRNARDGWDWRFAWSLVGAVALAVLVVVGTWRGWSSRIRLRWLLPLTGLASMVFAVLLALTDGRDGVLYGAEHHSEYLWNLPRTPPGLDFLRTFIDVIDGYSVHIRGHPPGFLGLLKVLAFLGVGGVWTTALLSVVATGVMAMAVLVAVDVVAGHEWVRRAAPFLVVAPYLIWMVTSADAVYTCLGAVGTAAIAVATTRVGWRRVVLGVVGGLTLGCLLFGTYLGAVFLVVPAAVIVAQWRRRRGAIVAVVLSTTLGAALVTAGFLAAGFWWFAGAARTKTEYLEGTAQFRTWGYFGLANLAAALIALGPGVFAGLTRLRDRRMWMLVGSGLAALAISHLSQYTKAEVERIWLLFYPWITLAAGSLLVRGHDERGRIVVASIEPGAPGERDHVRTDRSGTGAVWVGVQASCAIVLQAALVTKW